MFETRRICQALGSVVVATAGLGCGDGDGAPPGDAQSSNGGDFVVERLHAGTALPDKVDLLLVVDNSAGMEAKQRLLAAAVPYLTSQLVAPRCVNGFGDVVSAEDAGCPAGTTLTEGAFTSLHVGAISSSIGGHGSATCVAGADVPPDVNDRAQLLPTVRTGLSLASDDPAGFLSWSPGDDVDRLGVEFSSHVLGAGSSGCSFEAPLEAWYRFLVDPRPPVDMTFTGEQTVVPSAVNEQLLAQREAFLRQDSLVIIVMLSDENDCSIIDGGANWIVTRTDRELPAASETCDTNSNDTCCHNCAVPPPEGCPGSARCEGVPRLSPEEDPPNLRCFDQKRRFGIDFLYPPQRYMDAVTRYWVESWDGEEPSPLMSGEFGYKRSPYHVLVAGIVGVPWQDIATEDSLTGEGLSFLTARELRERDRWSVILGDPRASPPVPPTDPLMVESIDSRSGSNPITGDTVRSFDEAPLGNPINGHEYDSSYANPEVGVQARSDLQYACIFSTEPVDCLAEDAPGEACPCRSEPGRQDPTCWETPEAGPGSVKYREKAYPGTRFLEVLQGFGDNGIVASICPKHPVEESHPREPNAGYNPAMRAVARRVGELFNDPCLPRSLPTRDGRMACSVVQASWEPSAPACDRLPAQRAPSAAVLQAVREHFAEVGVCTGACEGYSICEIELLSGEALRSCLEDEHPTTAGVCYVDPAAGIGHEGLASHCGGGPRLRFVDADGAQVPFGEYVLLVCEDG